MIRKIIINILVILFLAWSYSNHIYGQEAESDSTANEKIVFEISSDASKIGFILNTTWHKVEGSTNKVKGTITSTSENSLEDVKISLTVDPLGLDSGNNDRDKQMREKHLEVDKYGTIKFESTKISGDVEKLFQGEEVTLTLTGNVEIHGLTKELIFPIQCKLSYDNLVVKGEVGMKISEFKIKSPSRFFSKVKDEFKLFFNILAYRLTEKSSTSNPD